jgi:hypothetical protein
MKPLPPPVNRMLRSTVAAVSCALAATLAYPVQTSPEEHVGINAERGDPMRWYVPADTPQLKYDTRVKEATAARAEALKDCRALQASRTDCEAQANSLYRRDMQDARLALGVRR